MRTDIPAVILSLTVALSACATAHSIRGPDGTAHQLVSCDEIEMCYSKATEVCGGNYKIVNSSSTQHKSSSEQQLLVKCQPGRLSAKKARAHDDSDDDLSLDE